MAQTFIVALVVVFCIAYAAWSLMPGAARRTIARAVLRLPLPAPVAAAMRERAAVASGCACDGCDRAPRKAAAPMPGGAKPITFHRRLPR